MDPHKLRRRYARWSKHVSTADDEEEEWFEEQQYDPRDSRRAGPAARRDPWPSHMLSGAGNVSSANAGIPLPTAKHATASSGDVFTRLGARPRSTATSTLSRPPPAAHAGAAPAFDMDRDFPPLARDYIDEDDGDFGDDDYYGVVRDSDYDDDIDDEDVHVEEEYFEQEQENPISAAAQAAGIMAVQAEPDGAVQVGDAGQAAIAEREYNAEQAAAVASIAPATEAPDSVLLSLYKAAAARCGRDWPPEEQLRQEDDDMQWQCQSNVKTKPQQSKVKLPLAMGFKGHLTSTWSAPADEKNAPQRRQGLAALDTETPEVVGFQGVPRIDRAIAGYLVNPYFPKRFPLDKEPEFDNKSVERASQAMKHMYGHLTTIAKTTNAGSLLQGSLSKLLVELQGYLSELLVDAGENHAPALLAEAKSLIDEIIDVNKKTTVAVGRAMANAVQQERARWLDVFPITPKSDIYNLLYKRPITHEGLFHKAMDDLIATGEQQRRQEEAGSHLPRPARPARPPPAPPRQPPEKSSRQAWRVKTERPPTHTTPMGRGWHRGGYRGRGRQQPSRDDDRRRPPSPTRPSPRGGVGRGRGRGRNK